MTSKEALIVLDREGRELARGTGTQERLACCAFATEDSALAAGRDVNRGPALLSLAIA
ncbi:MAG: hypothetical protein KF901_33965 [Myxococcales bacterium]|nr:hypothetical protein [Myxococcales bacterium]